MDSSFSQKDQFWFLRVCLHVLIQLYQLWRQPWYCYRWLKRGLALTRRCHEAMNRGAGHRKSSYAPSLGHLVLLCFVTCSFLLYSVETEEIGILRDPFRSNFVLSVYEDTISCVVVAPAVVLAIIPQFMQKAVNWTFVATDASVVPCANVTYMCFAFLLILLIHYNSTPYTRTHVRLCAHHDTNKLSDQLHGAQSDLRS